MNISKSQKELERLTRGIDNSAATIEFWKSIRDMERRAASRGYKLLPRTAYEQEPLTITSSDYSGTSSRM